jgi:YesN/AraC family two-component response regulator
MVKILVIDDEKPTLSMFRLFLEAWGYLVLTAENGTEGLEIFRKEKPAIVITDIKMPGIDGLAVLQRILDIDPRALVIVITGHGDTDLAQQALENNAVDFIHKPIKKEALDAALRKARERLDLTQYTDSR